MPRSMNDEMKKDMVANGICNDVLGAGRGSWA